jgi:hypothetical protein
MRILRLPALAALTLAALPAAADDTLDKIDPKDLAQNVAVWAAFLYTVADSDIDFRKAGSAPQ